MQQNTIKQFTKQEINKTVWDLFWCILTLKHRNHVLYLGRFMFL